MAVMWIIECEKWWSPVCTKGEPKTNNNSHVYVHGNEFVVLRSSGRIRWGKLAVSALQRAISRRIPESVPDSRRTHHFLESWHQEFGPALVKSRNQLLPLPCRPLEFPLVLTSCQLSRRPLCRNKCPLFHKSTEHERRKHARARDIVMSTSKTTR